MRLTLVLALILASSATTSADPYLDDDGPASRSAGTYGRTIFTAQHAGNVEITAEWLRHWRRDCQFTASYLKVSVLDDLLKQIDKAEPAPFRGPPPAEGESRHQVTIVGGRAAYIIEQAIGVELPVVNEATLKQSSAKIKEEAARAVAAYKRGVMQAGKEYGPSSQEQLVELKQRYHGKIGRESSDAERFAKLLSEWFPLGKLIEELDDVLGDAGEANRLKPERTYLFKSVAYTFELDENGVIQRVFILTAMDDL